MAMGNVLATNFLFIIFLVVPGLAGIKGFVLAKRETDNYSRIETIVFSLLISILSVLILYAGHSFMLSEFADFEEISQFGLPNIIFLFLLHAIICPLLGGGLGITRNVAVKRDLFSRILKSIPYIDVDSPREEVWDFVFEEIHSNTKVSVVTKEGHVISGNVVHRGDKVQERDLLLSSPTLRLLNENGEYTEESLKDKTYSYVHNQDISHIFFQEDLNRGDEDVAEAMDIDSPEQIEKLSEVLEEHKGKIETDQNVIRHGNN
ncbi:hypothetical protein EL22_25500 [Halostagnicola sp. A56]|uniref:DUF6338 family protein n=1 Tax=Halostagnicola sp. A56 TaxID=1495067 RepID=UPI0004A0DBA0|nr:DUF6338 family protein [Halostagnicola sp. A56]KDE56666.1 hypothetical protein EL22_25500 [Halostagnicola sp. A56]